MKRVRAGVFVVAGLVMHFSQVSAQVHAGLDAAAAQSIVSACADSATQKGQSHAIAVLDVSGSLVAFLKMDGNTPGVAEFALRKAEAVAHWRFPTAAMLGAAESTPGFGDAPRVVTVAGGVPIFTMDGVTYLGAVGVSGEAPDDDAACAVAGIEATGFSAGRR